MTVRNAQEPKEYRAQEQSTDPACHKMSLQSHLRKAPIDAIQYIAFQHNPKPARWPPEASPYAPFQMPTQRYPSPTWSSEMSSSIPFHRPPSWLLLFITANAPLRA